MRDYFSGLVISILSSKEGQSGAVTHTFYIDRALVRVTEHKNKLYISGPGVALNTESFSDVWDFLDAMDSDYIKLYPPKKPLIGS